jgi:dolichol-phosphate mannosyltransferase
MTAEINARLSDGLGTLLTDSFCGFKAHRVESLRRLRPTVRGYAFPMQFWVQAAAAGLRVRELPVRLIYNDPTRTFGGRLDDAEARLRHYRRVLHREVRRLCDRLPESAGRGVGCEPCRWVRPGDETEYCDS